SAETGSYARLLRSWRLCSVGLALLVGIRTAASACAAYVASLMPFRTTRARDDLLVALRVKPLGDYPGGQPFREDAINLDGAINTVLAFTSARTFVSNIASKKPVCIIQQYDLGLIPRRW